MRPPVGELELTGDVPGAFAAVMADEFTKRVGDRFVMVLSGGPTAERCYHRLAASPGAIDWAVVDVLMGDERCVPADNPDANQAMVRRVLLDQVGPVGSFQPMDCGLGPAAYEEVVAAEAAFDVIHLGLGADGHTASLFPGSDALALPPGQLVAENSDPTGENSHSRMTLTLDAIARARLAVFTVSGQAKCHAFTRLCRGDDLPAARVRAGRVVWLVDPDAAGTSG